MGMLLLQVVRQREKVRDGNESRRRRVVRGYREMQSGVNGGIVLVLKCYGEFDKIIERNETNGYGEKDGEHFFCFSSYSLISKDHFLTIFFMMNQAFILTKMGNFTLSLLFCEYIIYDFII